MKGAILSVYLALAATAVAVPGQDRRAGVSRDMHLGKRGEPICNPEGSKAPREDCEIVAGMISDNLGTRLEPGCSTVANAGWCHLSLCNDGEKDVEGISHDDVVNDVRAILDGCKGDQLKGQLFHEKNGRKWNVLIKGS